MDALSSKIACTALLSAPLTICVAFVVLCVKNRKDLKRHYWGRNKYIIPERIFRAALVVVLLVFLLTELWQ